MMCRVSTGDGYVMEQLVFVRRTCSYMTSEPSDLLYKTVGVGELVSCLSVEPEDRSVGLGPHAGKLDLDPGLALVAFNRDRYRGVEARLLDAGFDPDVNDQGDKGLHSRSAAVPRVVIMDFLIPPNDETDEDGAILHIGSDLAAMVTTGLELAFKDRCWKESSGSTPTGAWASWSGLVCVPSVSTDLKGPSLQEQGSKYGRLRPLLLFKIGY